MVLVGSTEARAMITSVSSSRALQMKGVVDYISAGDVPGSNLYGFAPKLLEIFATTKVRKH